MKVLVADDDPLAQRVVQTALACFGYEAAVVGDGQSAWDMLQDAEAPKLAILDWMMPRLDGIELCRRVRSHAWTEPPYVILLTARSDVESIVAGLDHGADDYLSKPCDPEELRARLQVGRRVIELQRRLANRLKALEQSLQQVKQLQGLLPICCYCKRIRDKRDYWHQVESYIAERTAARFSHGICPECFQREVEPQVQTTTELRHAGTLPGAR